MMNQVLCNKYDARGLAFRITYQNDGIRESEAYTDAMDDLLDETQSCNRQESIKWMVKHMEDAITYGIRTQNKDWKFRFLAAYDICRGL